MRTASAPVGGQSPWEGIKVAAPRFLRSATAEPPPEDCCYVVGRHSGTDRQEWNGFVIG